MYSLSRIEWEQRARDRRKIFYNFSSGFLIMGIKKEISLG